MLRGCLYPFFLFTTLFGWLGVIVIPFTEGVDADYFLTVLVGLPIFTGITWLLHKAAANHWTTKLEAKIADLDWTGPLFKRDFRDKRALIISNDLEKFELCNSDEMILFDYFQLVGSEIARDGETIHVASRGGSIVGGMIGGAVAGSTGALIGALGAGKTTTIEQNFIKRLSIKLIVDGPSNGIEHLVILASNKPIDATSPEAVTAAKTLEEIDAKFQIMLRRQKAAS